MASAIEVSDIAGEIERVRTVQPRREGAGEAYPYT